MIETKEDTKVSEQKESKKGLFLAFFTIFFLLLALLGMFFVIQRKESLKITENSKSILNLTTAPENNPDLKPNPELTGLVTSSESMAQSEETKLNMKNLDAPKNIRR